MTKKEKERTNQQNQCLYLKSSEFLRKKNFLNSLNLFFFLFIQQTANQSSAPTSLQCNQPMAALRGSAGPSPLTSSPSSSSVSWLITGVSSFCFITNFIAKYLDFRKKFQLQSCRGGVQRSQGQEEVAARVGQLTANKHPVQRLVVTANSI